jgi:hypothetical protein
VCNKDSDCLSDPSKNFCYQGQCVSLPKAGDGCLADNDCHSSLLECNLTTMSCVGKSGYPCTADGNCKSGLVCNGLGVGGLGSGICGLKANGVSCTSDSECVNNCCSPINGPKLHTCQAVSDCALGDPQG